MLRSFLALLCAGMLCLSSIPASAAAGGLTILYTGNTFGEYKHCPTCGNKTVGGLARRAGLIRSLRQDAPAGSLLLLGGPWELKSPGGPVPGPGVLETLVKAFGLLEYDFALLSEDESRMLASRDESMKKWAAPGPGRVEIFPSPVGRVAVIAIPPLEDGLVLPNQELLGAVRDLAASARSQADLVVAVSPWGTQGERYLVERTEPDIDILLGSGPGPAVPGQLVNGSKTAWARPYNRGQTVTRVTVLQPVNRSDGHRWVLGRNIEFTLVPLFQEIPEDESMLRLLSNLP
jgi:2',3'-cyclic-nucleotide 2'-phosphodiesterase (5'-nucleotidase family)